MDYGFFIKNLPVELIELINSFVNPKTDYYIDMLKQKVKIFCLNGLMRVDDCGLNINHSYFYKKEFYKDFETIEKRFKININKNIDKILMVRDIFKKKYKPMKRKKHNTLYLKMVLEGVTNTQFNNGIMIMALILLGVKYKKKSFDDTNPLFYCDINNKLKKNIKELIKI